MQYLTYTRAIHGQPEAENMAYHLDFAVSASRYAHHRAAATATAPLPPTVVTVVQSDNPSKRFATVVIRSFNDFQVIRHA